MILTSNAFSNKTPIPSLYTCDGKNISPPLTIKEIPKGSKSLAIIADDPDAPMGTFVHWVVYNIPANTTEVKENTPTTPRLNDGSIQGMNDFGKVGYGGPCPPFGQHRYFFKVYALDTELNLAPNATKHQVEKAMKEHIIAHGELIGLYQRK